MYLRQFIDACEGFGWTGGPEFKTLIVPMASGREQRNAEWQEARHRYSLPFLNISATDYRSIRQMFEVARGQLHAFLYHDPLDMTAENELVAIGDGVEDTFQLSKLSAIDGVSYQRSVYAFGDDDSITVSVAGAPTTAFSLDKDRGQVVFDTPPANGAQIRWSGTFAVWVRFANDWLPFSIENRRPDGYAHAGTVDLIEVKSPALETSS